MDEVSNRDTTIEILQLFRQLARTSDFLPETDCPAILFTWCSRSWNHWTTKSCRCSISFSLPVGI